MILDYKKKALLFSRKVSFFRKMRLWGQENIISEKAGYLLSIVAFLSFVTTYVIFSTIAPFSSPPKILYVSLIVNLILLLSLAGLVIKEIVHVYTTKKGAAASRLHKKIVSIFSIVAITPTIIVAICSILFFEFGISAWFDNKIQTVLDNSLKVAKTYIREHKNFIKADILDIANQINSRSYEISQTPSTMDKILSKNASAYVLTEAFVFTEQGIVTARADSTISLYENGFDADVVKTAGERGGVIFMKSSKGDQRIRVLVKLDSFFIAQYLYISRLVDTNALMLVTRTTEAQEDYTKAMVQISNYRLLFNLAFFAIALLLLFLAVWMGLGLANKLMIPINNLVSAADKVGRGDLTARAPIDKGYDDLGGLTKAFNKMTWQLQDQKDHLISVNLLAEERRRFTEAVLSGVSAGIMGLDADGLITLPNKSALILLGVQDETIIGQKITDIMPEAEKLYNLIVINKAASVQDQIVIKNGEQDLNLSVRITAELKDNVIEGYVITFDDITDQVAAQRTAAWADVAQRIAHEIKNPLTPIQLSAERLKRKYLKEIKNDPDIFSQCTDTIIRQVRDLRQIVDEFSSFAKMPAPTLKEEKISELLKQAIFLQEVANNWIKFKQNFADREILINCDARLVGQALTNIIKNAVESIEADESRKEGIIEVKLELGEKGCLISVCDNGIGLPKKQKDRLTEPYVTTRVKGTGLGLAIVKKIMKDHGGNLILENNKIKGAVVTLIFPILRNNAQNLLEDKKYVS